MDNVTHSLVGLALARVGLDRRCPRAVLLLIVSANIPDLDIIALRGGALQYLKLHRGYSHCLICLPLLALLSVLIVAALYRQKLPWAKAWGLCCIGVASHLLLDWTNVYGIRLLIPFSPRWFHLDLNGLYDVVILAVLALAVIWPVFARLVSHEIGERSSPGRGIAVFALAFLVLFDTGRAVLHARAIGQLNTRLYDNAPPIATAALPDSFSPFLWTGVVESAASYHRLSVNTLGELDARSAEVFYKPGEAAAVRRAKATAPFRYFLYFARFPVWSEERTFIDGRPGVRLDLTDLRFGSPGRGSFHCIALEDSKGRVLDSVFTYGSGAAIGQNPMKKVSNLQ